MRLAEQHKKLTEKNPHRRGYLNFDRENLTRNIGGETRITDKLRFFMLIYSQQTRCQEKRSQKSLFEFLPSARLCDDRLLQPSTVSYHCRHTRRAATFSRPSRATLTYCTSARSAAATRGATAAMKTFKTLTYAFSVGPAQDSDFASARYLQRSIRRKISVNAQASVTVQGNPHTRGADLVIKGGGTFSVRLRPVKISRF